MAYKKFVGTFQNETEVLNKIDELKTQGYSDNDIYIVTNDADTLSIVRGKINRLSNPAKPRCRNP
ncbi:general stress protein [Sporosarcina sp. FSL K6-6792]|uniref:general stress protein n=1 Tax=Sporosarcina sp. FSL K6-6792 TaxID=2921559 RepID=UPI0030FCFA83